MYFLGVRRQYAAESGGTGGAEAEIIPFEPEPGNTGVEKKKSDYEENVLHSGVRGTGLRGGLGR